MAALAVSVCGRMFRGCATFHRPGWTVSPIRSRPCLRWRAPGPNLPVRGLLEAHRAANLVTVAVTVAAVVVRMAAADSRRVSVARVRTLTGAADAWVAGRDRVRGRSPTPMPCPEGPGLPATATEVPTATFTVESHGERKGTSLRSRVRALRGPTQRSSGETLPGCGLFE